MLADPMVQNLAKKLPETAQIYVFDVVQEALETISKEHPEPKVIVCKDCKDVASRSV